MQLYCIWHGMERHPDGINIPDGISTGSDSDNIGLLDELGQSRKEGPSGPSRGLWVAEIPTRYGYAEAPQREAHYLRHSPPDAQATHMRPISDARQVPGTDIYLLQKNNPNQERGHSGTKAGNKAFTSYRLPMGRAGVYEACKTGRPPNGYAKKVQAGCIV